MDDLYTKKCEKFSDVTKENFERIKDLRAESLGDKVYDDETIDLDSLHLTIYLNDDLIAYSRLYRSSNDDVSLQRFSVSRKHRNKGVSKILMEFIFKISNEKFKNSSLILTSRIITKDFYQKFGFIVYKTLLEQGKKRFYMKKKFK